MIFLEFYLYILVRRLYIQVETLTLCSFITYNTTSLPTASTVILTQKLIERGLYYKQQYNTRVDCSCYRSY